MSISITRYVDITSGVGAASDVAQRSLILRVFSQSNLIPAAHVVTFTTIEDVLAYFGQTSDEYKIAAKYFAFVSKSITTPRAISYSLWNAAAIAPAIFGDSATKVLGAFNAITAGNLKLIVNGVEVTIAAINLAAAASMAAVATAVETAIAANVNLQLADATVAFDTNNQRFILTGSVVGSGTITCEVAPTNDLGVLMGWATAAAVAAPGQALQTAVQAVSSNAVNDDNFGSFVFGGAVLPVDADMVDVAEWNHAQNNKFMFCVPVTSANAATQVAAMAAFSGTAITLGITAADHAETMPAEILASTDYDRSGASANYMYYQFANRTASVTSNSDADTYDALRVNYLGQTQSAGQQISFYQRGYLQGAAGSAIAMNVFAGEQWLKSAMSATILGMFLNVPNVPATDIGRALLLSITQPVIDKAVFNGVFAPGKALTATQKAYITQVTGNSSAWQQVQAKGYWMDAEIVSAVNPVNSQTEYSAEYTLCYGKNDQIMSVTGRDVLI